MQQLIYFFVLTIMLVGCSSESEKEVVVSVDTFGNYLSEEGDSAHAFFRNNIITIGNHHFIPLQVSGQPDEYPRLILSLLELFEKIHPDLQVTGWSIEKRQEAYGTSAELYGIWVDTEPRPK